jgi:hypothetical protein
MGDTALERHRNLQELYSAYTHTVVPTCEKCSASFMLALGGMLSAAHTPGTITSCTVAVSCHLHCSFASILHQPHAPVRCYPTLPRPL